jgi:transcriptional regulator
LYVPKHYDETRIDVLHGLIGAHPLGVWVTLAESGLVANHIPFLVERERGAYGTLVGHVARANPIWRTASTSMASVVIFQGPEGYISPSWYPSKKEHGRVVPTWNYAVVHAHGLPRVVHDTGWLRGLVERLTVKHESGRPVPWKVSDAPPAHLAKSLEAIVGIEIPIDRIEGKWKMSQNQPAADRQGIVDGLRSQDDAGADAVARLVEERSRR